LGSGGVVFDGEDDGIGVGEAGEVVDVAVGVVARDAAVEPDGALDAEPAFEEGFVLFAGEAGVALLDGAEEALFGGEEETLAVDVDGAAFEDDAAAVPKGEFGPDAGGAGGEFAGAVVACQFGYFAQPLKCHLTAAHGVGALDEQGAEVAGPTAVGGGVDEGDAVVPGAGSWQGACAGLGAQVAGNEDPHVFVAREDADDLAVEVRDGFELAGPVGGLMGPGEPGGGVRFPLGGHAEGGGAHGRSSVR
jgi:hypothetical protein